MYVLFFLLDAFPLTYSPLSPIQSLRSSLVSSFDPLPPSAGSVLQTSLETRETYGEWYPSMLDGEILSRGQGFVGTQWSTLSMVSGLRVE